MDTKIVKHYGKLEGHQFFPREVAAFAYGAGFRLNRLVMAVTIALAESAGYAHARHMYFNVADEIVDTDRGMWQLHSKWHAEVSDVCAYNPKCAASEVFRITKGGTEWGQWSSYQSDVYKDYRVKAIKGVINFYAYHFHKKIPYFENLLNKFK